MKRLVLTSLALASLYLLYVAIGLYRIQIKEQIDIVFVTTYISLFIVVIIVGIILYDYFSLGHLERLIELFLLIMNANYFLLGFVFGVIPNASGMWAGGTRRLSFLFYDRFISDTELMEYNIFFKIPTIVTLVGLAIMIGLMIWRNYGNQRNHA
jgi:cytochrome b subunit of formate dehydrogenase